MIYKKEDVILLARNSGYILNGELFISEKVSAEDLAEIRKRPLDFKSLAEYLSLGDEIVISWAEKLKAAPLENMRLVDDETYAEIILSWPEQKAQLEEKGQLVSVKMRRLDSKNKAVSCISLYDTELTHREQEDTPSSVWVVDWLKCCIYGYAHDMSEDERLKLYVIPLLNKLGSLEALFNWVECKRIYNDNKPFFNPTDGL